MREESTLEYGEFVREDGRRACGDKSGGKADEDGGVRSREDVTGEGEDEDEALAAQLCFSPHAGRLEPLFPTMPSIQPSHHKIFPWVLQINAMLEEGVEVGRKIDFCRRRWWRSDFPILGEKR